MAEIAKQAALEPTFDLPTGGASDFYLSREMMDSSSDDHGKIIKKEGLWDYPFLTRRTGDSLVGTNEEITSAELRHGRTAGKSKIGTASSSGNHDFEFSPETFDDQLEGTFESRWVRWKKDGEKDLITKDFLTPEGYIHVRGDDGTYNQVIKGKEVTAIPLFYTENEVGDKDDPFGLIKISEKNMGEVVDSSLPVTRKNAKNPLGKFIVHELHIGEEPVKYTFTSRIPINDDIVRYQNYKHVQIGEMSLNVTVNAIVTGSFMMQGANNPEFYTQVAEAGKTRMADKMGKDKDMAIVSGDKSYSSDYKDAAEKFLKAVKDTTKSTNTDQFTALEGFLYVNGHQLQFASDLTMDINKNIQPINAIFVKNAIANIEPKLDITGNITTYFTDGEMDSSGMKFGADNLKNLASTNKDVEIVYAFQDKEDPETLYLFQIFKATFAAPSESKDAESPITLDLNYTSYGEMGVRCLRIALPKIRAIKMVAKENSEDISLRFIPNVPLSSSEASYVTPGSDDYILKGVEVYVDAIEKAANDYEFSGLKINADGSISGKLTLTDVLAKNQNVQVKIVVNGETCEGDVEVIPEIPYLRMGEIYANNKYKTGKIELTKADTLNILSESYGDSGKTAENYLFFWFTRQSDGSITEIDTDDLVFTSSDTSIATVVDGIVTGISTGEATINVASAYDKDVHFKFKVAVSEASSSDIPEEP